MLHAAYWDEPELEERANDLHNPVVPNTPFTISSLFPDWTQVLNANDPNNWVPLR